MPEYKSVDMREGGRCSVAQDSIISGRVDGKNSVFRFLYADKVERFDVTSGHWISCAGDHSIVVWPLLFSPFIFSLSNRWKISSVFSLRIEFSAEVAYWSGTEQKYDQLQ